MSIDENVANIASIVILAITLVITLYLFQIATRYEKVYSEKSFSYGRAAGISLGLGVSVILFLQVYKKAKFVPTAGKRFKRRQTF